MILYGFMITKLPITIGCDVAGTVEKVGANVKSLKTGDRVFGFTELGREGTGTFAEYCVINEAIASKVRIEVVPLKFKISDSVKYEEASTLGVTGFSASFSLKKLNLPLYPEKSASSDFLLVILPNF